MIIQGLLVSTSSVVRTALEERLSPAQFVVSHLTTGRRRIVKWS